MLVAMSTVFASDRMLAHRQAMLLEVRPSLWFLQGYDCASEALTNVLLFVQTRLQLVRVKLKPQLLRRRLLLAKRCS